VKAVVKEIRSYDAYGLTRHPNWKSASYTDIPAPLITQGYTGHDDDPELGLIDMKGRVYDPQLARFLTPDPVIARPEATQPWNPYVYVSNNPLRNTDPTGLVECVGCEEFWGASQAFWEGGGAGLAEYGRGQLEREFTNLFYRMQRPESAWGDGKHADRLHKYSEKKIQKTACTIVSGTATLGTRATPQETCGGTVSRDETSPVGNPTTTPGMTDAEADAYLAEYCRTNLCADEVTVYGQPTDWDRMWCKGAGCIDTTRKSQQWTESIGSIERIAWIYIAAWSTAINAANVAGKLLAEYEAIGLQALPTKALPSPRSTPISPAPAPVKPPIGFGRPPAPGGNLYNAPPPGVPVKPPMGFGRPPAPEGNPFNLLPDKPPIGFGRPPTPGGNLYNAPPPGVPVKPPMGFGRPPAPGGNPFNLLPDKPLIGFRL
jgi:RHS repeat-associated protein